MRLLIFGASGHVGRLVVAAALARGHEVYAFTHRQKPFEDHPKLTVVQGDIHDSATIRKALADSRPDAVISALGSWHTKTKDILSTAMAAVIPAMEASGNTRIISLTGAGAYAPGDRPGLFSRLGHMVFNLFAGKIIADAEEHLRQLAASQLDWTVLRAPVMSNQHLQAYRLTMKAPGMVQRIPRRAVAQAMLDQAEGPAYSQRAPFIVR